MLQYLFQHGVAYTHFSNRCIKHGISRKIVLPWCGIISQKKTKY